MSEADWNDAVEVYMTILFSGVIGLVLGLVLAGVFAPIHLAAGPVKNPDLPDAPVPPPEPIQPGHHHGWEAGHMSDIAKNCAKPGDGRPWCRLTA